MGRKTTAQLTSTFVDDATVSGSNFADIFDSNFNLADTTISVSNGSLNILGTLFAERLKVSSSIIYGSGSSIFGDDMADTHQFTGSVLITGSTTATSFVGDILKIWICIQLQVQFLMKMVLML